MSQYSETAAAPDVREGVPWVSIALLVGVFFAMGHDLRYSVLLEYDREVERFVEGLAQGNPIRRLALLLLGAYGAVNVLLLGRDRIRPVGVLGALLLVMLSWLALSTAWAEDMRFALQKVVSFLLFFLAATAVAIRFSPRAIEWLALIGSSVYLVIGLAAELALGTFQPFAPGYRFIGTLHPNHQGLNCALLVLAGLAIAATARRGGWLFTLWALAGLPFLALTGSRTAFATTLLVCLIFGHFVLPTRRQFWFAALGVLMLSLALLVVGDPVVSKGHDALMLGRESSDTLNGRLPIWEECLSRGMDHAVVGHGYRSFWSTLHLFEVAAALGWDVNCCHSAFVDVFLDLGLLGLVCYFAIFFFGLRRSRTLFRRTSDIAFAWMFSILVLYLLIGLLESLVLFYPEPATFLALVVVLHLGFLGRWDLQSASVETRYRPVPARNVRAVSRATMPIGRHMPR